MKCNKCKKNVAVDISFFEVVEFFEDLLVIEFTCPNCGKKSMGTANLDLFY